MRAGGARSEPGEPGAPGRRRAPGRPWARGSWLVAGAGLLLVVAGVTVFLATAADPVTVTTYAGSYEPSTAYRSRLDLAFDGGIRVVWTGGQVTGLALGVAGLLAWAAAAGWWWRGRSGAVRSAAAR